MQDTEVSGSKSLEVPSATLSGDIGVQAPFFGSAQTCCVSRPCVIRTCWQHFHVLTTLMPSFVLWARVGRSYYIVRSQIRSSPPTRPLAPSRFVVNLPWNPTAGSFWAEDKQNYSLNKTLPFHLLLVTKDLSFYYVEILLSLIFLPIDYFFDLFFCRAVV